MNSRSSRTHARRFARLALLGVLPSLMLAMATDANAQIAGTANRPIPNVLLLVDSSGSMERMGDNSLPSANNGIVGVVGPGNQNACSPGVSSFPNRWGMLVQALTGNIQPYYSCDAIDRSGTAFKNEYRIGNTGAPLAANYPYDTGYFLPYHRPLAGGTAATACAWAPYTLPGVPSGSGVGPGGRGNNTAPYNDAASFPPDAFTPVLYSHLTTQYGTGLGSAINPASPNDCSFSQVSDGQLDATQDYIRFSLMTFDNDTSAAVGVTGATPPAPGSSVDTVNPFLGQWTYQNVAPLGLGNPVNCAPAKPFDVGARHVAAPPWEGRMIRFPDPNGSLFDIEATNQQIQQVLLATRPYGATPIDGMMADAQDYLTNSTGYGPNGDQIGFKDDYVKTSGCRKQFIVLLTDGAPNLNLRPSCETGNGQCPYPNKAAQTANVMSTALGSTHVDTYVIGFSVNGAGNINYTNDGFPVGYNNCKSWYNTVTTNGANLAPMQAICSAAPTATTGYVAGFSPPPGSTADACCQLLEIAYYGTATHNVGPYFAETQADLVLSFGRILGGVSKDATTRTLPGYSPPVSIGGTGVTADFVASFIPNALKPWSGEIDRTRFVCDATATPQPQLPQSTTAGDSYAYNTAAQAAAGKRLFVTFAATPSGSYVDSLRTLRPWVAGTPDGAPTDGGTQQLGQDMALASALSPEHFGITNNTCGRSKDTTGTAIPALNKSDCEQVIWGFASAHAEVKGPLSFGSPAYNFNVRCKGASSATNGTCSVSGTACTTITPACPTGEVCVPQCSALGAIYRSSPTLVGPPNELLRDDAYRSFSQQNQSRRPTMFVATTDGVLHAFKALSTSGPPLFDNIATEHELWAFVPPAVLPRLATNYPTGQQILLDGTPAVKDVVWDRNLAPLSPTFHTTLVAGMGAGGGGYYALNVTDVDCQGNTVAGTPGISGAVNGCLPTFTVKSPLNQIQTNPKGPHFLWQLTDIEDNGGTEPAKRTHVATDGKKFVALFGKESGNPAIATLNMNPDSTSIRQMGVAILPGGIDSPPVKGSKCPRAINGGAPTAFLASDYDRSDNVNAGFGARTNVRRWTTGPCSSGPVPGRGVTIVDIATGKIIRHFGRKNQDVPQKLNGVTTDSPFDSPIIGTPVVYPSAVGVTAQKIFVGDADGTIWRIDVHDPDPTQWKVTLFQDLLAKATVDATAATESQPIQMPPVLSLDPLGAIVVHASTGDQENIVASTDTNYLFAVRERLAISASEPGRGEALWYQPMTNGRRVTGPMTVFDRSLYFATYDPILPGAATCTNDGTALLWGMDYINAQGGLAAASGGLPRWCPIGQVDNVTGACKVALVTNENPALGDPNLVGAIIPGVSVRASASCGTFGVGDSITGMSATTYGLFFGATARGTGGVSTGTPQAGRPAGPVTRPLPRKAASIDAWALVAD
jgi:type IV pilus assembly protein PilY1